MWYEEKLLERKAISCHQAVPPRPACPDARMQSLSSLCRWTLQAATIPAEAFRGACLLIQGSFGSMTTCSEREASWAKGHVL